MRSNDEQPSKGTGEIYSVSQLNHDVRSVLEGSFPMLWIEGEISNFARPASGHIYFSLKDSQSQVRCAMFRGKNNLLRFQPESGMQVLIYARVSFYEGRGEFQLIVERMEPMGEGALQLAFEQLKQKLQEEGLFDQQYKKPLPSFPQAVGVVTSSTGAAVKDILSVLRRRFPALAVIIYPTLVQGEGAGHSIARTIHIANERQECDVLIVSRGGGSLEDLWAFNEEVVARAIDACDIPVLSGVGHQIDSTIADFVADSCAPTPSAAAELISQDQQELKQQVEGYHDWFVEQISSQIERFQQTIDWLEKRLVDPGQHLQILTQRLQELDFRLRSLMQSKVDQLRIELGQQIVSFRQHNPAQQVVASLDRCQQLKSRLSTAMERQIEIAQTRIGSSARALNTISPLATLERGYAIIQKKSGQEVVRSYHDVQQGDLIRARLGEGSLTCVVEESNSD